MNIQQKCIEIYRKHKHLKLAADEIGIPWQTVYVHLRRAGEPVTGDKLRYGSDTDRLAAMAEREFLRLVPIATDMNRQKFQSKVDFVIRGYGVDVKASRLKSSNPKCRFKRWAFSIKKQEATADFFVCLCLGDDDAIHSCLLIPGEIARHYTTISISERGGKWGEYAVPVSALAGFFSAMPAKPS